MSRAIALGFFDGVHLGHISILNNAAKTAARHGLTGAALTFDTHPKAFVGAKAPELIMSLESRMEIIEAQGLEVIALPFDDKTAAMTPEEFARLLIEKYDAKFAICGENFRFGVGASGSGRDFESFGLSAILCPPVKTPRQEVVSSTAIRRCIREGDVNQAKNMLGRPFFIKGKICGGTQTGRRIGFPTANTEISPGLIIPRRGVYITDVEVEGVNYRSVTNVGTRPTFSSADIITIENHLLDFEGDLYGKLCTVRFLDFIRPEQTFSDVGELTRTIEANARTAREYQYTS